jgi:iron complex transport system substrate-binding protein
MKPLRHLALVAAVLCLGLLALTGCTTGSTDDVKDTSAGATGTEAEKDAFPVTITHAFGKTTIESEPKRVATIGYVDQDMAVAVGVVPVGASKVTYGGNAGGSTDFFDAAVEKLGGTLPTRYDDTDGIAFADVAKVQPDLILAVNSGLTKADYAKLSKIAPTVAFPGVAYLTPWRTTLETVGKALGRSDEAAKVLADTEAQIDAAKKKYPDFDGASLMWTYLSSQDLSTVGVYGSKDTRVAGMRDFGFVDPPAVLSAVKDDQFYASVSAEKAADLQSDVMFAFIDKGTTLDTYAKNPLVGKIPALADGHTYAETDEVVGEAVTNPSPLSFPFIIDTVLPKLDAALQGS